MNLRRVVVTGLTAITPIGNDLSTSWKNLLDGVSGIGPITRFDAENHATKIAGELKGFDATDRIDFKQLKRMDRFTVYAVYAAQQVMENAALTGSDYDPERLGAIIGVGLGGLETIEIFHKKMLDAGPRRLSPFFIPILIANMAAGQVSIFANAQGPNYCTTSACASGLHAVGCAYTDIMLGRADMMICGGAESTITPLAVGGFNAMKAISTRNDDPQRASRPFDVDRDGFVMGEGCGLLVLEELEHAKARGARIYAEVKGYGASGDAYHMAAPPEDGMGMYRAMAAAVRESGLPLDEIDHINAHATSTPVGDSCEVRAINRVFGERAPKIAITANKSMIGHLLGAAGGVESVFTVMSIYEGVVPPTINVDEPEEGFNLDCVTGGPRKMEIRNALNSSFGFGGTNASVIFGRFEE